MKHKNLFTLAVIVAVLGLLALLAWQLFEIYPRRTWTEPSPSREAALNEYLALDRWLEAMGHPVRVVSSGNLSTISNARERQIFLQASLFRWTGEAAQYLARWIEEGGSLFLVLDYHNDWEFFNNDALLALLDAFGIEAEVGPRGFRFSFEAAQTEDILVFEYTSNIARLAQIKRGIGRLTVSSRPLFLRSGDLRNESSAHLAWMLFAANEANSMRDGENGWLFIRGTVRPQGHLGTLFRHGNLAVVIASALVLIAVCFWAAIPMFGLVRRDNERSGKLLRERFMAEGRFLKRYGALGVYRDAYIKEIKRQFAAKESLFGDDEVLGHALEILGKTSVDREGRMLAAALRKETVKYRELPEMIAIFKTILERV